MFEKSLSRSCSPPTTFASATIARASVEESVERLVERLVEASIGLTLVEGSSVEGSMFVDGLVEVSTSADLEWSAEGSIEGSVERGLV